MKSIEGCPDYCECKCVCDSCGYAKEMGLPIIAHCWDHDNGCHYMCAR